MSVTSSKYEVGQQYALTGDIPTFDGSLLAFEGEYVWVKAVNHATGVVVIGHDINVFLLLDDDEVRPLTEEEKQGYDNVISRTDV